jgi:hypothetical protein
MTVFTSYRYGSFRLRKRDEAEWDLLTIYDMSTHRSKRLTWFVPASITTQIFLHAMHDTTSIN